MHQWLGHFSDWTLKYWNTRARKRGHTDARLVSWFGYISLSRVKNDELLTSPNVVTSLHTKNTSCGENHRSCKSYIVHSIWQDATQLAGNYRSFFQICQNKKTYSHRKKLRETLITVWWYWQKGVKRMTNRTRRSMLCPTCVRLSKETSHKKASTGFEPIQER